MQVLALTPMQAMTSHRRQYDLTDVMYPTGTEVRFPYDLSVGDKLNPSLLTFNRENRTSPFPAYIRRLGIMID